MSNDIELELKLTPAQADELMRAFGIKDAVRLEVPSTVKEWLDSDTNQYLILRQGNGVAERWCVCQLCGSSVYNHGDHRTAHSRHHARQLTIENILKSALHRAGQETAIDILQEAEDERLRTRARHGGGELPHLG